MTSLDYLPFDADNHYYEGIDSFTRHVPREMQHRCVQIPDVQAIGYCRARDKYLPLIGPAATLDRDANIL